MKTSIYVLLLLLGFSLACQREKTIYFIPGIYVNHSRGTYSIADDTLMIRLLEGHHYEILRKTGFNRLREGKVGKREYERETWQAIFDEDNGVLNEGKYGKVISFFPDSGLLRVGSRVYKKTK